MINSAGANHINVNMKKYNTWNWDIVSLIPAVHIYERNYIWMSPEIAYLVKILFLLEISHVQIILSM